jgi:type IV pilus assembly protein PilN
MIKINLLPYHEKAKKENVSRQIFIAVGSFLVVILLLILGMIQLTSTISNLESQVVVKKAELAELNKKIGDLEKFKADKKELEQKLAVIHTLEENRLAPVKTLDDLAALVPPQNIWLVKVTQKGDSFGIEGVGRDNIAVADFMKTVETFEPIKSVNLVSSKKTEISGITLQLFIFSCVMKKGF